MPGRSSPHLRLSFTTLSRAAVASLLLLLAAAPIEAQLGHSAEPQPLDPGFVLWVSEVDMYLHGVGWHGEAGAQRLQAGIGLLSASGGHMPHIASGDGPSVDSRWRFDAGFGLVRADLPSISFEWNPGGERRGVLTSPWASVGATVFEGFETPGSFGDVVGLNLVGELRWIPAALHEDLRDGTHVWGLGARLGLLRGAPGLPDLIVSGMHRRSGTLEHEGPSWSGQAAPALDEPPFPLTLRNTVRVAPRITSLRAETGGSLRGIGVFAGVQRDRIRGDGWVRTARFDDQAATGVPAAHYQHSFSLPVDRTTWFVGFGSGPVSLQLGRASAPPDDSVWLTSFWAWGYPSARSSYSATVGYRFAD